MLLNLNLEEAEAQQSGDQRLRMQLQMLSPEEATGRCLTIRYPNIVDAAGSVWADLYFIF